MNKDYKELYGKKVTVITVGREASDDEERSYNCSTSLEGKLEKETSTHIWLRIHKDKESGKKHREYIRKDKIISIGGYI